MEYKGLKWSTESFSNKALILWDLDQGRWRNRFSKFNNNLNNND